MCRHAAIDLDEAYPAGPAPMYKRDHKAAKHPKPSPKVLRRQKWHKQRRVAVDHELVLLEISRMQRAAGVL